jgi:hypothetical protein
VSELRIGWVRITSKDPPLRVDARLAEDKPTVESGYGGWEEVPRPRRRPLTTFTARPGLHLSLSILLDGWRRQQSVERQISQLERMGGAGPSGSMQAADGEPPQLKIDARGGHVPYQGRTWVIAEIAWGDALMNKNGDRVRQQATLSLIEYVEDVHLQERSAASRRQSSAKRRKKKAGAPTKRVTVKRSAKSKKAPTGQSARASTPEWGAGEDLASIAARELGDAERWVEIAALNGIRDPRAMTPGQVIRLP